MVKYIDIAWDNDDAWECTKDQAPIRVLVADYRHYVNGHILGSRRFTFYTMDMQGSTLRRNCFDWFNKHAHHEFENEDIRNCPKTVEVVAATSDSQIEEEVLE